MIYIPLTEVCCSIRQMFFFYKEMEYNFCKRSTLRGFLKKRKSLIPLCPILYQSLIKHYQIDAHSQNECIYKKKNHSNSFMNYHNLTRIKYHNPRDIITLTLVERTMGYKYYMPTRYGQQQNIMLEETKQLATFAFLIRYYS